MYNTKWIERPVNGQNPPSPEEAALRETFLAAQKIALQLVCASNQLSRCESPDVTACAALVREAVNKPEKDRTKAIKAAEDAVRLRQLDYISTFSYFLERADAYQSIRATLVSQLEAVALPKEQPREHHGAVAHVDLDLSLNCEAVAGLLDECDTALAEGTRHHYSHPTLKLAEAAFQKLFDDLVAEVGGEHWSFRGTIACQSRSSDDILRDLPLEKISSTSVPAQYEKLTALYAAREAFEQLFCYGTTTTCRDFQENTRGRFNDTQLSESLLAAMPDVAAMQRVEQQRDTKLRSFARSWRYVRRLVDDCQALWVKLVNLLPEALAETAAIEDAKVRRQAQNLCLYAARRLQASLKYIRDCDRKIGDRGENYADISAAMGRGHEALVERIKSKQLVRPHGRCRPTGEYYNG